MKPLDEAIRAAKSGVRCDNRRTSSGGWKRGCKFLTEHHPMPVKRLGIADEFGQSGTPDELLAHYGLDTLHIEKAVRAFIRL